MRLQKYLAKHTTSSRRRIEAAIASGAIYVNESVATLGQHVANNDRIVWGEKQYIVQLHETKTLVAAYHKPVGQLCAHRDSSSRVCVYDCIPACPNGKWIAVGRLDINTSGLLLFTNNGELAHTLMHPSFGHTRIYNVRVFPRPNTNELAKLTKGVMLDGHLCTFKWVKALKKDGHAKNVWFQVATNSGRYRMVRRMWQSLDCKVSALKRIAFSNYTLPNTLEEGQFVILNDQEAEALMPKSKNLE